VSSPGTRSRAPLAGFLLTVGLVAVAAAGAARPVISLHQQASTLDARAHRALLDLYALDSRLHAAAARVAALQSQSASLRREQSQLSEQLVVTRHTLALSQHRLAQNLSTLYKQNDVSALAVVLGATSLNEAVTRLDYLDQVATQSHQVMVVTTHAKSRLGALQTTLAAERAKLTAATAAARAEEHALAAARAQRVAFIADLERRARYARAQIRALEATAEQVVARSDTLSDALQPASAGTAPATTAPATTGPAAPAPVGAHTITVSSTGYALAGRTATGMPVGWGVVAVDPSVIPLGTRLTIPGYGEAVAADTGGAVRGNTIDLWFPTLAQAQSWGRRTITITLH
jgi:3D (Asp-Asp-Asp) domain-containing protein